MEKAYQVVQLGGQERHLVGVDQTDAAVRVPLSEAWSSLEHKHAGMVGQVNEADAILLRMKLKCFKIEYHCKL